MKFLQYLIIIPFIVAVIWAVIGAESEGIRFPYGPEEGFKTQYVLVVFLFLGYLLGRIGAWFGYSPLRRDLRLQKRTNKALNKEQIRLNETVTDLKKDIIGMQAKVQQEQAATQKKSGWWNGFRKTSKKGNS
jgi:hypothetical protein